MSDIEVHGLATRRFSLARDAFAANLASVADVGACFTATVEGETAVDL
jgi:hypothetical protein